jgi:deazaflavin-dependent oxidoreductase (nitroreductase family)
MSNYQQATAPISAGAMNDNIRRALAHGHTIDITTTGRKSRSPRRIEIVFHNFDGGLYISGLPAKRRRGWLANLVAEPAFTFHLKRPVAADLPATAREVTDPVERRSVLTRVARVWNRTDVDTMVDYSPLVEVTILDRAD